MSSIIVAGVLILIIVLISLVLVSINNRHRKKNAIELVNSGGGKNKDFTASYAVNVVGSEGKMVNNLQSLAAAALAANATGSNSTGSGGSGSGGSGSGGK